MPILFGCNNSDKLRNTIFSVDSQNLEIKQFKNDQIDLYYCDMVQVLDSLYAHKSQSFKCYKVGKLDNAIQASELQPHSKLREYSGIANYDNRVIFLVGGDISKDTSYYRIDSDTWHEAPALNEARY